MLSRLAATMALGLGFFAAPAAFAEVNLSSNGAVAYLQSKWLQPGDDEKFAQFLDSPDAAGVKIIYLDSFGGSTDAAQAIGHIIREHHLATAFHVGHGQCVSACTTMFVAGEKRYYIGGGDVHDGIATHVGLGFHPPANGNEGSEDQIDAYYHEMGVPHADDLRYKVYSRDVVAQYQAAAAAGQAESFNPGPGMAMGMNGHRAFKIFFAGGKLALKMGIATSLDEPKDPSLRDDQ